MTELYAETEEVKEKVEAKKRGNPSESVLRQKVVPYADEILNKLLFLMREGDNSNVQIAAAKTLFSKIVPDLKAVEVHGGLNDDGTTNPITFLFGNEYDPISRSFKTTFTSVGSAISTTATVQNSNLASEVKKDDNSNIPNNTSQSV